MLKLAGAARRLVTLLLAGVIGLLVLALLGVGGLAWRLGNGPLDVTGLAARVLPLVAPGLTVSQLTLALGAAGR